MGLRTVIGGKAELRRWSGQGKPAQTPCARIHGYLTRIFVASIENDLPLPFD
jgi:hypothetical protein